MKANSNIYDNTQGSKFLAILKKFIRPLLSKYGVVNFTDKVIPKIAQSMLNSVTDNDLRNAITDLYHPNPIEGRIGDGGTAAAIRHQIATGELVGGVDHIKKGKDQRNRLKKIIAKNDLSNKERRIAEKLLNDLNNALGGRKNV